eukprot:2205392-Rhodomonas_salina.1
MSRRGSIQSNVSSIPPTVAPTRIAPTVQPHIATRTASRGLRPFTCVSVMEDNTVRFPSHPLLQPVSCLQVMGDQVPVFHSTLGGTLPPSAALSAGMVLASSQLASVPEDRSRNATPARADPPHAAIRQLNQAPNSAVQHLMMGGCQGAAPQVLAVRPAPQPASLTLDMEEEEPASFDIQMDEGLVHLPPFPMANDSGEGVGLQPRSSTFQIPDLQDEVVGLQDDGLNLEALYDEESPRMA